jgi:hypothetical protein
MKNAQNRFCRIRQCPWPDHVSVVSGFIYIEFKNETIAPGDKCHTKDETRFFLIMKLPAHKAGLAGHLPVRGVCKYENTDRGYRQRV